MTAILTLKAGKEKSLLRRHPWVYDTGITAIKGNPGLGDTVIIQSAKGEFLATAAFSPHSSIRARAWSFNAAQTIDAAWFAAQLQSAITRRAALYQTTGAVRLVFGEGDGLPGLVVDHYSETGSTGGVLVMQCLSAGVAKWRDDIASALQAIVQPVCIVERGDAAVRSREGLPEWVQVLSGALPAAVYATENGVRYTIDVLKGHKTGFYIDQRDSRSQLAQIVAQRKAQGLPTRVLNCFSYTGGFSLAAAKAGADAVISVDSSQDALNLGAQNAALNGLAGLTWQCDDVFAALKNFAAQDVQFDCIVLDPPKFAPSKHHLDKASRAYKELTLKGLKLLAPQGHLLTFSCSGAMDVDLFQKVIAGAVIDSRLDIALLSRLAAGIDHPMLMTHPEGEYLKGLWLQKQT